MTSPKTGSSDSDWSPINRLEAIRTPVPESSDQHINLSSNEQLNQSNNQTSPSVESHPANALIGSPGSKPHIIKPNPLGSRHSLSVLINEPPQQPSVDHTRSHSAPPDNHLDSNDAQRSVSVRSTNVSQSSIGEPSPLPLQISSPISQSETSVEGSNPSNESLRVPLNESQLPGNVDHSDKVTIENPYQPSDFVASQPDEPMCPDVWETLVASVDIKHILWLAAAFTIGYWAGSRTRNVTIHRTAKSTQTTYHTIARHVYELIERRDRGISYFVFRMIQ